MNSTYKLGDQVKVLSLKRIGTILAILGKNSFKVSIGDLQMNCKYSDLELTNRPKSLIFPKKQNIQVQKTKYKTAGSLDLHGFTVPLAKEALITFISRAVMSGYAEITVIHGHGGGAIKSMVHATLSELEVVASFRHPIHSTAETKIYLR